MKLILMLSLYLISSCSTPAKKGQAPQNGPKRLVPISVRAVTLDASGPVPQVTKLCVKVKDCQSGFKTLAPICTGSGDALNLAVGDKGCKLVLSSFGYNFPERKLPDGSMQPAREADVMLSPEQRDRLADAAVGEMIQFAAPIDDRFSFMVVARDHLPAQIDGSPIEVRYSVQATQRGEPVEVQLRDTIVEQFPHFLEVCEGKAAGIASGERSLFSEIKKTVSGLSCRDVAQNLSQRSELTFSDMQNAGSIVLDFALMREFENLKKFKVSGYKVAFGQGTRADLELTIEGQLDTGWIQLPASGTTIRKLTLDQINTLNGEKPISDFIPQRASDPLWASELILQNIVHENYEGLDAIAKKWGSELSILDTFLFDDVLIKAIQKQVPSVKTFNLASLVDAAKCNGHTDENSCLFNQCVWAEKGVSPKCKSMENAGDCSRVTNEAVCKNKSICTWDSGSKGCIHYNARSACSKVLDSKNCGRLYGCFWANSACVERARVRGCAGLIYWRCATSGCSWNINQNSCS